MQYHWNDILTLKKNINKGNPSCHCRPFDTLIYEPGRQSVSLFYDYALGTWGKEPIVSIGSLDNADHMQLMKSPNQFPYLISEN